MFDQRLTSSLTLRYGNAPSSSTIQQPVNAGAYSTFDSVKHEFPHALICCNTNIAFQFKTHRHLISKGNLNQRDLSHACILQELGRKEKQSPIRNRIDEYHNHKFIHTPLHVLESNVTHHQLHFIIVVFTFVQSLFLYLPVIYLFQQCHVTSKVCNVQSERLCNVAMT